MSYVQKIRYLLNQFNERPHLQMVSKNIGWLLFERLTRIVIGLGITVWVARYLGPENFGELSFALAFVACLIPICNLGLEQISVRNISIDKGNAGNVLGTVACLRLTSSVLTILLGFAAIWIIYRGQERLILISICMGMLFFQVADIFDYWFQSQLKSRLTVSSKLTALILAALLKILCILMNAPIVMFALIAAIESAFYALSMFIVYSANPYENSWAWNSKVARSMLADGLPIMFSNLAIMMYMRIDQIMLGELADAKQLGLFSAIIPLSEGWYVIATSICTSLLPQFSRLHIENKEKFRNQLQRLLKLLAIASIGIAACISVSANQIVNLLFGTKYNGAGQVLAIHVWGVVFVFFGVAENLWLMNSSKNIVRIYKTVLGAVVNITLNWFLIPSMGAVGAAIATIASFSISAYFSNILFAPDMFKMQTRALLIR